MWRCFICCSLWPSRWAGSVELGASGLWSMMLVELGLLVAAVVPAVILGRVEKRAWGTYGLPGRLAFGKLFWVGAVWGFASITLLMATMYGMRVFDFGHLAYTDGRIVKFALFWAVYFLLVGSLRNFLLRGYSQFTLTRLIGFWPAAVLLSCTFRSDPFAECGRGVDGIAGGGGDWIFLLSDSAAHREFVVCGGLSYGVGLGRDIFLFCAG